MTVDLHLGGSDLRNCQIPDRCDRARSQFPGLEIRVGGLGLEALGLQSFEGCVGGSSGLAAKGLYCWPRLI